MEDYVRVLDCVPLLCLRPPATGSVTDYVPLKIFLFNELWNLLVFISLEK
jgi:hypothetical protein